MPLLKPTVQNQVQELLAEILPPQKIDPTKKKQAREVFDNAGLTLERIAKDMSHALYASDESATKHKIWETALKVHGAMDDQKDQKQNISINFTFVNATSQDGITGILIPRSEISE